nr:EOG090X03GO [Lepidurus arcticus]
MEKLENLHSSLYPVATYVQSFQDVRQEYFRHSQYAAAMDNMKQLFAVPESVSKTHAWINDGQLLHAHQSLMDLEQARDALLFELHRTPVKNSSEAELNANQIALMTYFVDVEKLGADLAKQLWLIMKRALNAVRKEPHGVVTALRIIEREEQADAFALERQAVTGFTPPGRPKMWKAKCLSVLEESVVERIEGNQFEERSDSKLWLVRHLEVTRQIVLEDLRVVRTLCVPVFPPHWDPIVLFMGMYEKVLKSHLCELSADGLESNEYTTLLAWARHVYPGKDLMGHPDLGLQKSQIAHLLDAKIEEQLAVKHLKDMGSNYNEWLKKTLAAEAQDWREDAEPVRDSEGYFHTEAPIIVFQMVEQNLQVAATVGKDLVRRVLIKSFEEIIVHGALYKNAVQDYKLRYFEDRSQIPYFAQYIIAILNNCDRYVELGSSLRQRYDGVDDTSVLYNKLQATFQEIRDDAVGFLLEEAFLDLEPHFTDVCTRKWLGCSTSMDTIFATLSDYFQDYVHLCPNNLRCVLLKAQDMLLKKYLGAFFQRKLNLKVVEERRVFSERLRKEGRRLEDFVQSQFEGLNNQRTDETVAAVTALSEIVKIIPNTLKVYFTYDDSKAIRTAIFTLSTGNPGIGILMYGTWEWFYYISLWSVPIQLFMFCRTLSSYFLDLAEKIRHDLHPDALGPNPVAIVGDMGRNRDSTLRARLKTLQATAVMLEKAVSAVNAYIGMALLFYVMCHFLNILDNLYVVSKCAQTVVSGDPGGKVVFANVTMMRSCGSSVKLSCEALRSYTL